MRRRGGGGTRLRCEGSGRAVAVALARWSSRGVQQTGGGGTAGSLTVYSGQHVQTTQALVAAFERATGISVSLRSDDEDVLADQIVTEGSRSPADVFYTGELAAVAVPGLQGPARSGRGVDARRHAGAVQLTRRQVGRGVGPGQRDGVQHVAAQAARAADLGDAAGGPQVERPNRHRRERDRLPTDRDLHRPDPRGQAALTMAGGRQGECGRARLPGQRDGDVAVNRGQAALGIINQYYWYRERAEVGAIATHSAIAYFAAARRRVRRRRVGRRASSLRRHTGRRPSGSWPF